MKIGKIIALFKAKDLRRKILFVLFIMAIFRLTANIPIPGIDKERWADFLKINQFFGLMNLFTGGALQRLSIVMLGLGPYITAIIIMQLLTLIFPRLEEMYKEEGEAGRRKFNQYARILTVPLALLQSFGMLRLLQAQKVLSDTSFLSISASLITITAGSIFLMWLGELITEKGIGNGISLLIFAGIVARVPVSIHQAILNYDPSQIPSWILFFSAAILICFGVVIINEARRNVPVAYAKRIRGNRMYGGAQTYLPIMINPAGVIPIIFALSILMLPGLFGNFFASSKISWLAHFAQALKDFSQNSLLYGISYFTLVFLFTYFYTAVTFDPDNIAENLQKMGGFIPGVRPGKNTADFIRKILNRVLFLGAISLGLIAVMPSIIQSLTKIGVFSFAVGGTSLLIIVSVVLETAKQIESELEMRAYE